MPFFTRLKDRFSKLLSNEIGIDLGTANTLVYVRGKGIIINEPTVVAVNQKTDQVVAVGSEAKRMLGRSPEHIKVVRPLIDGVISDFEVTEEMLAYFINKAQGAARKLLGPRVVIGVPSGITNVERRAVRDAARGAGAREIHIVEEPVAAALGIRLPVSDPVGNMVIDMGGGTTDIAIISLNGIVNARNVNIAGDRLNRDIISHIRDSYQILIGEKTAEELKMSTGSVMPQKPALEAVVRGRDLVTGLPREIIITDEDIRDAIGHSIDSLIEAIKEVIETTPPEVIADVMQRGLYLVGGGALLRGFDVFLSEWLKVPVYLVDDPLTPVARGTGIILEDLERYQALVVEDEYDLPLR
ncbi:rod shape-determining protein [Candidatus Wolfebacteria bacterium]|nr:rod shape-determining protein [Candidatus Wolfebacteria bacterium]